MSYQTNCWYLKPQQFLVSICTNQIKGNYYLAKFNHPITHPFIGHAQARKNRVNRHIRQLFIYLSAINRPFLHCTNVILFRTGFLLPLGQHGCTFTLHSSGTPCKACSAITVFSTDESCVLSQLTDLSGQPSGSPFITGRSPVWLYFVKHEDKEKDTIVALCNVPSLVLVVRFVEREKVYTVITVNN